MRILSFTRLQQSHGFSLLEMLIAVGILTILAYASIPLVQLHKQQERESDLRLALRQIRSAIDQYKNAADTGKIARSQDDSGYPKRLEELIEGVADKTSPQNKVIYFLRSIPRDPLHPDATTIAAQTWGLRSYSSPPDSPTAGEDIFDVYSLSTGVGLNGIPYREW